MSPGGLRGLRGVLWAVVAVAAIGSGVLWFIGDSGPGPGTAERYGAGDYQLVNNAGEPVDDTVFVGQPSMVFFGFTHCPEVCPTTMGDMALWFDRLGDDADDLRAFFVTVDPERDTQEALDDYVSWVSDRITGITGPRAEIDKIIDAFSVHAEKVPMDGAAYNMNHTASVFLLDSRGRYQGTIAYGEDTDTAVGKLRKLVNG